MRETPVQVAREDWVLGWQDMSAILGVSKSTMFKMVAAGMPKLATGRYYLPDVIEWLRAPPPPPATVEQNDDYIRAQIELADARRDKVRIETETLAGKLVPLEEVAHVVMGLCQILVGGLEGLPPRTSATLAELTGHDPTPIADTIRADCGDIAEQLEAAVRDFSRSYRASIDPPAPPPAG